MEQPLLPYESCTLGSINLANHVHVQRDVISEAITNVVKVDYNKLKQTTHTATLFLNRVLDASELPIHECQEAMELTRKIGLGIMGLHDMLIQLGLPYDSQEARDVAGSVMEFIARGADEASMALADEEGFYGACMETSDCPSRRNANLTTVAPTGTLSMIADCSSGCEPYYAPMAYKTVLDGTTFAMPNKWAKNLMESEGVEEFDQLSKASKNLLKGAGEISPKDHVLMQAAIQKWVDSSISKTINMPSDATVEDVKEVYELAYKSGCKGITVYRDGSRNEQVLSASDNKKEIRNNNPKRSLPDSLNAKRYRLRNQDGEPIYIIVCFDENEAPMEVFAKFPYDNRIESKDKTMMWTTICRLVSLALRCGTPISEIIKQLDRSSGSMFDLPAQLGKLLKSFMAQTHHGYKKECKECGGEVVFTEGCEKCLSCGNSKCS